MLELWVREHVEAPADLVPVLRPVLPGEAALLDFLYDRLRGYLRDQGYTAQEVAAVVDARPDVVADLPQRLAAVRAFEAMPEAAALAG